MNRSTFSQLVSDSPILLDGAWGTQLQEKGLTVGEFSDPWNLTHPERVEEVARSYVEAGSRIILTNTFQANRYSLERAGLSDQASDINRAGAEISKRAANGRALVFGSIGPTGKMLSMGEASEVDLHAAFLEQAEGLAQGGADAVVLETFSDLPEAKIALKAAMQTGLPVVVCFCFDSGKEKDRTMMGVGPELAAVEMTEAGADAVGANCGQGIEGYLPICERLHRATSLPIWVKANAGLPVLEYGRPVYRTTPTQFGDQIPRMVESGATFVGGCCGTNPEFIRAGSAALGKGA